VVKYIWFKKRTDPNEPRNVYWLSTKCVLANDQSSVSSWFVQQIKELSSAAGRCAGRGCALVRQLADYSFYALLLSLRAVRAKTCSDGTLRDTSIMGQTSLKIINLSISLTLGYRKAILAFMCKILVGEGRNLTEFMSLVVFRSL